MTCRFSELIRQNDLDAILYLVFHGEATRRETLHLKSELPYFETVLWFRKLKHPCLMHPDRAI